MLPVLWIAGYQSRLLLLYLPEQLVLHMKAEDSSSSLRKLNKGQGEQISLLPLRKWIRWGEIK